MAFTASTVQDAGRRLLEPSKRVRVLQIKRWAVAPLPGPAWITEPHQVGTTDPPSCTLDRHLVLPAQAGQVHPGQRAASALRIPDLGSGLDRWGQTMFYDKVDVKPELWRRRVGWESAHNV